MRQQNNGNMGSIGDAQGAGQIGKRIQRACCRFGHHHDAIEKRADQQPVGAVLISR